MEKTFKLGQKFTNQGMGFSGTLYMLALGSNTKEVILINTESGGRWSGAVKVENTSKITLSEMERLTAHQLNSFADNEGKLLGSYKDRTETVRINAEYSAVVHHDKIVVGCQTVSAKDFENLVEAYNRVKARVGS